MVAASAVLALVLGFPGAWGYCRRPPPANPTRYVYKGTEYRFPVGYGVWNSPQPLADILYILLTEVLGIDVEMKPPYGGSEPILRAIAGCPENTACTDAEKLAGDFLDPPELWMAAEVWTTSNIEKKLMSYCVSAGPIGYASTPSLQTYSRVHAAAEQAGELIGFWRSLQRPSANAFFSSVSDVEAAMRQLTVPMAFAFFFGCDETTCNQPGLVRPGTENGAATPSSVWATLAANGVDTNSDGWYYSPACRSNTALCVPVVLGARVWNFEEWCKVAAENNLPLAITFVGWFGEMVTVQGLYSQNLNFLFYWWTPDNTFLNVAPQMMFFDESMLYIRQFQYTHKVIWPGIRELDEDLFSFLTRVSLTDQDMAGMMQLLNFTNRMELACNWVKANEARWQRWLPSRANCLRGFYFNETELQCKACSAGYFADERGMRSCTLCGPGKYANSLGQTACIECEPGKFFSGSGAADCELCPHATYGRSYGMGQCTRCPGMYTTATLASIDVSECVCPAGTFKTGNTTSCQSCPASMTCAIGSDSANMPTSAAHASAIQGEYPRVNAGYYTLYSDPFSVYKCAKAQHCVGGPPESCFRNLLGFNCAECPEGYDSGDDGCSPCSSWGNMVFVILTMLVTLAAPPTIYYMTAASLTSTTSIFDGATVTASIIVTTAQLLAIFARLNVPWPASVMNLLRAFRISLLRGKQIGVACIVGYDPILSYAFEFVPILLVFVVAALYFVLSKLASRMESWNFDRFFSTCGTIMQVVFVSLCGSVVRPLQCYTSPNGTKSNASHPQVLCWESREHAVMLLVCALPLLTFVIIPFLAINVLAAVRAPAATLVRGVNAPLVVRFRYLFFRFRPNAWWWGIPFAIRQLALAFAAMVQPDDPSVQVVCVVFVLMTYLALAGRLMPWRSVELNFLDCSSMFCFLLLSLGVGAFLGTTEEEASHSRLMVFLMITMFVVFGSNFVSCAVYSYHRGFAGYFGVVYPGGKTLEQFTLEWLDLAAFFSKKNGVEIEGWLASMIDFDRRTLHTLISISQGMNIKGERKFISSTAPKRLTLDLNVTPKALPRPSAFRRSPADHIKGCSRLSQLNSADLQKFESSLVTRQDSSYSKSPCSDNEAERPDDEDECTAGGLPPIAKAECNAGGLPPLDRGQISAWAKKVAAEGGFEQQRVRLML